MPAAPSTTAVSAAAGVDRLPFWAPSTMPSPAPRIAPRPAPTAPPPRAPAVAVVAPVTAAPTEAVVATSAPVVRVMTVSNLMAVPL